MPAYKNTSKIKEEHGCPIYCIAFNFASVQNADVFASVGSNKVLAAGHSVSLCSSPTNS